MKLIWNTHRRTECAFIFVFYVLFAFGDLSAQTNVWQPSPGHTQIPIWPGPAPDAKPVPGPESTKTTEKLYAGKPVVMVLNVSQPTMTVYSPKGTNTGVAVVVFPGGGYNILAIDLEGTEVCDWLTSRGITAVLLKYRVPSRETGPWWESSLALQDAQRTLGLVRFHAAEWHIDPYKIGVLGFSAGGHMVAAMSTHFDRRLYSAVDAADRESCRPDFAVALYPGHLSKNDGNFELNPNVPVSTNAPPTFLVHTEDDPVNDVCNSLAYYIALKKAKVPVEMHLYAQGGHAFGLRHTTFPVTTWPQLVETWLETIWMTSENPEIRGPVAALASDIWREREQAVETLGNMGRSARGTFDLIIERLADEEWQVRRAAASALSRMGPMPGRVIPCLIAALADEEWQVRKPAALALAALGPTSAPAVPALMEALGDEEWQVRSPAVLALAAIGPPSKPALDRLIGALDDEEWKVRKHAVQALSAIGMPSEAALSAIRQAVNDEEDQVRRAAAAALKRLADLSNEGEGEEEGEGEGGTP